MTRELSVKVSRAHAKFETVYELFAHNVFYRSYQDFYDAKTARVFDPIDYRVALMEYFKIELPII